MHLSGGTEKRLKKTSRPKLRISRIRSTVTTITHVLSLTRNAVPVKMKSAILNEELDSLTKNKSTAGGRSGEQSGHSLREWP
jgi:hypothetical protein